MCEPQSWAQQQHGLHRMLVGGGRPATPLLRTGAALITAAALVQDGCRAGPPHRPAGLHGPQRAACPAAAPVGQPRAAAAAAAPAAGGCAGAGLERPVSPGGGMWQPSTGWGQARAATASSSGESGEGVSRGGSMVPAGRAAPARRSPRTRPRGRKPCPARGIPFSAAPRAADRPCRDTQFGAIAAFLGVLVGVGVPAFYVSRDERDDERLEELRALNRATKEATGEYMTRVSGGRPVGGGLLERSSAAWCRRGLGAWGQECSRGWSVGSAEGSMEVVGWPAVHLSRSGCLWVELCRASHCSSLTPDAFAADAAGRDCCHPAAALD